MRISAKAFYACVAMVELAANHAEAEPVPIKSIAVAQGIPVRFLVQILLQLKTRGLVTSLRGQSGGYRLGRPPESVSLAEVINAIDDRELQTPARPKPRPPKKRKGKADRESHASPDLTGSTPSPAVDALLAVWREIQAQEQRMLEGLSLAELARRSQSSGALSYQI